MNLVATGVGAAVVLGVGAVVAALLVARSGRPIVVGALTSAAGVFGTVAGIAAMSGQTWSVQLPGLLPLSGIVLSVDALGGVFMAVSGAVATVAAIYGIGYCRPGPGGHGLDGRAVQAVLPLFVVSLLLVPAAGSIVTLLVCWELMALTSLLLVVAEHRRRAEVASAGRWYAVMTHLGFVAILIGLLVLAAPAAGDSYVAVRVSAGALSPVAAGLVFVLCLVGFGSKAGIVPLHAWLPRAHPEAPSHVSALMSAAMVNMGVYGIVRVGVDLMGVGSRWWWLLVLLLGAVSAVYGILQAVISTDLKRLLAYSTTENMGLVLVGVGASGLFASTGRPVLAALALTAPPRVGLSRRGGGLPAPGTGSGGAAALRAGARRRRRVGAGRAAAGDRQRAPLPRLWLLHPVRTADLAGDHPMSALGTIGGALQAVVIVVGSPLLLGLMRQVRARLEGRSGAGIGQPWRDLRKQLRKQPITPRGTSEMFRAAPVLLVAMTLVVAVIAPFVTTASALPPGGRPVRRGRAARARHRGDRAGRHRHRHRVRRDGRQPGDHHPGPGRTHGTGGDLRAVGTCRVHEPVRDRGVELGEPARVLSPASLLAAVALVVVVVAETGRLPVDNPSTHLELTMVHEAMVLEYAGPDLALIELGSAMRLSVYPGLLANLFLPWGIATEVGVLALAVGVAALVIKVAALGALLAFAEVFLAKVRLFRVPELLAGSFLLALLAVTASYFLA